VFAFSSSGITADILHSASNADEPAPLEKAGISNSFGQAFSRALTRNSRHRTVTAMKAFTAVIERCPDTGLYVGFVPGFPGAHSQGESLDELQRNLREVIEMLLEDGEPELEAEFVGTQSITVAA
jgi:predicted RNase H-like HicB family nuclease